MLYPDTTLCNRKDIHNSDSRIVKYADLSIINNYKFFIAMRTYTFNIATRPMELI